jgi:hypothetical protein
MLLLSRLQLNSGEVGMTLFHLKHNAGGPARSGSFPRETMAHILKAITVLVVSCLLFTAQASTITYIATDLVDVNPGEDLWRYDYTVSGRTFLQAELFDIYFDPSIYESLTAELSPSPDWDVLVLQQPSPGNLPPFDVGIYDVFALTDDPPISGPFAVTFIYLGSGSPGAQEFAIFDASSALVETGLTTVPGALAIPEPSTAGLALLGLAAVLVFRLKQRHRVRI